MSNQMRCPKCGSTNVECTPRPTHQHRCHDCGYDGRGPHPIQHAINQHNIDRAIIEALPTEDAS